MPYVKGQSGNKNGRPSDAVVAERRVEKAFNKSLKAVAESAMQGDISSARCVVQYTVAKQLQEAQCA